MRVAFPLFALLTLFCWGSEIADAKTSQDRERSHLTTPPVVQKKEDDILPNSYTGRPSNRKRKVTVVPSPPSTLRKLDIPGPADTSNWFRYYQAGEAALIAKDPERAQKYLLASLAALEKAPPKKEDMRDPMMCVKLSALEQYLEESYPTDWSKCKDREQELKLRKEQTETLYRIAKINELLIPADDLLRIKSTERYVNARRDYTQLQKTISLKPKHAGTP